MCAQMLGKARLALSPPQPEWLHTALAGLGIELDVWEKPQELADTTPFSENRRGLALLLPGRGDGIGGRPPGRSSD